MPSGFRVCQDAYSQPLGRVFLTWNNEASYDSHCILLDGRLEAELPGSVSFTSISGLVPGAHTFGIQSHCASLQSVLTETILDVLVDTPHPDPVRSMRPGLDPERGFIVELELNEREGTTFESVDIFEQKVEDDPFPRFLKCLRLDGTDRTTLVIPEIVIGSRVFFQFFDESCHGSASVECTGPPMPQADQPFGLQVFQNSYPNVGENAGAGAILCWVRHGGQKGFEILVDGKRAGAVGALLDTFFLEGLEPGNHDFEVRMIPPEGQPEPAPGARAAKTLLPQTPNPNPVLSIRTAFHPGPAIRCAEAVRGTRHVSWEPGPSVIQSVDVFLRRGDQGFRSVITVGGDVTEIDLLEVFEHDEVALQFFDEGRFGSPVFDGWSFRRGDPNASAAVDISDAVVVLSFLFSEEVDIECLDAADANDDAHVDISDAVTILNFLFGGDRAPPAPGPAHCGLDMTPDGLSPCRGGCAETKN